MTLDLNKLTEKAQEALAAARRLAEERQHTQVAPEHLLDALVAQEDGVVPAVLRKLGVPPRLVLQQLDPAHVPAVFSSAGPPDLRLILDALA